ncbi:hypothetical protein [Streptomyces sp. NPDC060194]|uniref:hypothetical protein n=1 Tax=Streptomyces sp. NPDC060194 TaxID=3347069 RepID=UPI00365F4CE8
MTAAYEPDLAPLVEKLVRHRLLTVTGPGGVGKSHLAARLAEAVEWPVHRADLSTCRDAALVPQTVAAALGVALQPGSDPLDSLLAVLRGRRGLLLLDTCEHVLTGCAYLAGRLHEACPQLRTVATSRRALGVPGEQLETLRLLPPEGTVELLRDKAALQGVDVPEYWARLLAEQLDGDPLSTQMAARSLLVMPPQRLYGSLSSSGGRFAVLTDGPREPARHRTLLRSVEWSYELCARRERLLWARLSAFTGPFTHDQVRMVFTSGGELASLVEGSVVIALPDGTFRLPVAHREYGQMRLAGLGGVRGLDLDS